MVLQGYILRIIDTKIKLKKFFKIFLLITSAKTQFKIIFSKTDKANDVLCYV